MTKADNQPDDLEATRQVAAMLQPFPDLDRERIIRWAREKLGMAPGSAGGSTPNREDGGGAPAAAGGGGGAGGSGGTPPPAVTDIKSFINTKDPQNGTQFAATTAYYYRFLAPDGQKKESINVDDLLDAYRKADRDRPKRPGQTLVDAYGDGVFDKAERGFYKINTVGENLVAMVLPGKDGDGNKAKTSRGRGRTKPTLKKKAKTAKKAIKKTAKRARK